MKKIKLHLVFLATLFLMAIVSISCSKNKELGLEETQDFTNPLNFVGVYHNRGLEFMMQKLPTSISLTKNYQDSIDKITILLEEFISTIPSGSVLNNDFVDRKELSGKLNYVFKDFDQIKNSKDKLTEKQIPFIKRLMAILNNNTEIDSAIVFNDVAKLEKEIWKSDMAENEKIILLTATAVGKYSWKFWSQEHFKNAYFQTRTKDEVWPNWKELKNAVVEGDILGAMAGAIGGCIGGAVVGTIILPGVGSITACILEAVNMGFQGAVLGSTLSALKYLIFE